MTEFCWISEQTKTSGVSGKQTAARRTARWAADGCTERPRDGCSETKGTRSPKKRWRYLNGRGVVKDTEFVLLNPHFPEADTCGRDRKRTGERRATQQLVRTPPSITSRAGCSAPELLLILIIFFWLYMKGKQLTGRNGSVWKQPAPCKCVAAGGLK